jgi:hypothetical protein
MRRYFYTLAALALTVSMVHASGPLTKGGAAKPVQPKGQVGAANSGFSAAAVGKLPTGFGAKPGFYGTGLQGQPCKCTGTVTVKVRKVFPPVVDKIVAVPLGQTPGSKQAVDITAAALSAAGAGQGVNLGKLLAGAFSSTQGATIWITLSQPYVDYAYTYACVGGRWTLVDVREVGRGTWSSGWVKVRNSDGSDLWLTSDPASDLAKAIDATIKGLGF